MQPYYSGQTVYVPAHTDQLSTSICDKSGILRGIDCAKHCSNLFNKRMPKAYYNAQSQRLL